MKRLWTLSSVIILQQISSHVIEASIAGVTYMDHFDFKERYRDVNECNPLYWHPLHLPEECLLKFEMLLRSKLKSLLPYRVLEMKQNEFIYPTYFYTPQYEYTPPYTPIYTPAIESSDTSNVEVREKTPFEVLFDLLEKDMRDLPQAPTLGSSPYLGLMALYRQPVSYKSAAMIKKLSEAYAKNEYYKNAPYYANNKKYNKNKIGSHDLTKRKKQKIGKNYKIINKYPNDVMTFLKIKELK